MTLENANLHIDVHTYTYLHTYIYNIAQLLKMYPT